MLLNNNHTSESQIFNHIAGGAPQRESPGIAHGP